MSMIIKINAYKLDRLGERYPMTRVFTLPVQLIDGWWGIGNPWQIDSNNASPSSELCDLVQRINSLHEVKYCIAEGNTLLIDIWSHETVPGYHTTWRKLIHEILEFIAHYLNVSFDDLTFESDADKLEAMIAEQIEMMKANKVPIVSI
jgi:hypothetical protein